MCPFWRSVQLERVSDQEAGVVSPGSFVAVVDKVKKGPEIE